MRPSVVVLGMMASMPVAGVAWQTVQYLVGFQRLGFDVVYAEAHARTPSKLMTSPKDDATARAAAYIDRALTPFGLGDRWAFHALHDDGSCHGLSERELQRAYGSADLILNLHGGTEPLPEHYETGRLVYVETDPVALQVELAEDRERTIAFLEPHTAFFTFGERWGSPGCGLPTDDRFAFQPTRQPVVLDFWTSPGAGGDVWTTVGNWRQLWRDLVFEDEVYTWSKHHEFAKILDLPKRTGNAFELALGSYDADDERLLASHGWRVRPAEELSGDLDAYRGYIVGSRGELTVAKDQNVRLRTGWFSDRSATYLAAGRPVVTQDTGFDVSLPVGEGLLPFATLDEAAAAIEAVEADYERHATAALEIARDCFATDVVLRPLLAHIGVEVPRRRGRPRAEAFPPDLVLEPRSRRPTVLPDESVARILAQPLPAPSPTPGAGTSVVVVTYDGLAFTRLSIESLLEHTRGEPYELVVVDNGSTDSTRAYLERLARLHGHVRVLANDDNRGFPAAVNQGLEAARGDALLVLNNDALVPPGWLPRFRAHLADPEVGLLGPVTNRIGNEAEIHAEHRTYGGFLELASSRLRTHRGRLVDLPMLAMYCLALRRDAYERLGPLDEGFTVGLLEDDDYSRRARAAGYRVVCAEDVFVHHIGEASFGRLVSTGAYGRLLAANKRRYEEKWHEPWQAYERRPDADYDAVVAELRQRVATAVPDGAVVLVVSRGDDRLLELDGRRAWHFPQTGHGLYAGHHPANSAEAIAHLEALRAKGGRYIVFPRTGYWWLEHYDGLRSHLDRRYRLVGDANGACLIYALDGGLA